MNEHQLYETIARYLQMQYPHVLYRFDLAADLKLTVGQAAKHKRLHPKRGWPDLFIAEPKYEEIEQWADVNKYAGLMIELKREGTTIYKKSDGQLVKDKHIREQAEVLSELSKRGYKAEFAVGFDEAKRIIDEYLGGGKHEVVEF